MLDAVRWLSRHPLTESRPKLARVHDFGGISEETLA